MTSPSQPLIIMIDTETLGLGPNAVVWQAAFMAVPKAAPNPKNYVAAQKFYLPIQPQLDAGRTIEAGTLGFWIKQPDASRLEILEAIEGDADELTAYVRSFIRKILNLLDEYPGSEIWTKGSGFDLTKLIGLFTSCGESAPWHYRSLMDVRTICAQAGVHTSDVDSSDIVAHDAQEDCRLQLRLIELAFTRLGLIDQSTGELVDVSED